MQEFSRLLRTPRAPSRRHETDISGHQWQSSMNLNVALNLRERRPKQVGRTGLESESRREPRRTSSRSFTFRLVIAHEVANLLRVSFRLRACANAILNCTVRSKIPHFIPQTNPTPPDESDTTGQIFFEIRMIPTPPDQSDRMHPSFNPKVPGSRPGRPTDQCRSSAHSCRNSFGTSFTQVRDMLYRGSGLA